MKAIVNFFSNRVLAPVWNFLDGKKTAGAAVLAILSGLAGLGAEVAPLLAAHNTAGLLDLIKHSAGDPSIQMIVAGLGGLGLGHKLDKAAAAPAEAPKP
jgi:hypothetical protein